MTTHLPEDAASAEELAQFRHESDVEVIAFGDESRKWLARVAVRHWSALRTRCAGLLDRFRRGMDRIDPVPVEVIESARLRPLPAGEFFPQEIEVFAERMAENGDLRVHYSYSADGDTWGWIYVRFDIHFRYQEPPGEPFVPVRLVVQCY